MYVYIYIYIYILYTHIIMHTHRLHFLHIHHTHMKIHRSPSLLLAAELDVPREEARCYVANPHLRPGCRLPLPVMSLEKATRNMSKEEFIASVQVCVLV